MFKKDDIIFLAAGDSAASIEHVVLVKEYDEQKNIIVTNKCVTFIKDLRTGAVQSFINFGIYSSMPAIENGTYGDTIINLNKFDFCGLVTEKSMIDNFNSACSKLIVAGTPEAKNKSIIL